MRRVGAVMESVVVDPRGKAGVDFGNVVLRAALFVMTDGFPVKPACIISRHRPKTVAPPGVERAVILGFPLGIKQIMAN